MQAPYSFNDTTTSAFHRLGEDTGKAYDLDEAMALAGVDYEVALVELQRPLADGTLVDSGHFATVRTDTEEHLGNVGSRYRALQNRRAFGVLEPLLDAGLARMECGSNLGADAWMMVQFLLDAETMDRLSNNGKDPVAPYGIIVNNHAGRRAISLKNTPIRAWCSNLLGAILKKDRWTTVRVPHTGDVEEKIVVAAETLWADLTASYARVGLQFEAMRGVTLTEEQFNRSVLDAILPLPKYVAKGNLTARQEGTVERTTGRRSELRRLWDEGLGHTGDHSAWEAFQAVTQAIDHDREMFRLHSPEGVALLTGSLDATKSKALESIVAEMTRSKEASLLNEIIRG